MFKKVQTELSTEGVAVFPGLLSEDMVAALRSSIEKAQTEPDGRRRQGELFGLRNVLQVAPTVREMATSDLIHGLVGPVLGAGAAAVRGLFFDKTPAANWRLGWHQDRAIAVARQVDVPGYAPWSLKIGIHHVFPPAEVLENMLAVRVHLDDADATNGALEFIPRSHTEGILTNAEIERSTGTQTAVVCEVKSGDVILMRPLTIHRSAKSTRPSHRRVVHIEYAGDSLQSPLEWNEFHPFTVGRFAF